MIAALLAFVLVAQPTGPEPALEGRWRNPAASVVIAIGQCGQSLCGRVEWASDKATADARKGGTDPLLGTVLLSDIQPRSAGRWKARLFVPDINKRSKAELILAGDDRLKVSGCAVGGIVCRSQLWTRVPAN